MFNGHRLLSFLLLVFSLSSAPLGSMEQACERGSTTVSIPLTGDLRDSKIAIVRVSADGRSSVTPHTCGPAAPTAGPALLSPKALAAGADCAPPHGGFELAALLGFRATAPPRTT
jgi:hypothetical protein